MIVVLVKSRENDVSIFVPILFQQGPSSRIPRFYAFIKIGL